MKRAYLIALLLLSVVAWAQMGGDQAAQAGVQAGNQAWIDAMRSGNAAAVASIYATDAIACSLDGRCNVGRAAIEQSYRSMFASMGQPQTVTVNSASVTRDRDLAFDRGSYEVTFSRGNNIRERYLVVWQRQAGGWKILRDLSLPLEFRDISRETRRPSRSEQSTTLRCDSDDMRRHTCAAPGEITRATLSRQISGSACVQGTSWGWQGDSIWVDRGCRAEFTVIYSGDASREQPNDQNVIDYNDPRTTKSIRCESDDMNYKLCPAGGTVRGARLVRQISGSACTEATSWGWKAEGVWVDKGCRAEFEVTLR